MLIRLHVKYLLFLSDLNETCLNFLDGFSKTSEMANFMKIRPVGVEFLADGRTDRRT